MCFSSSQVHQKRGMVPVMAQSSGSFHSPLLTGWFWVALQKATPCVDQLPGRNDHLAVAALASHWHWTALDCASIPVGSISSALPGQTRDPFTPSLGVWHCVGRGRQFSPSSCSSPASTVAGLWVLKDKPLPIPLSTSFTSTVCEFVQSFEPPHATSLQNLVVTWSRNWLLLCRKLLCLVF